MKETSDVTSTWTCDIFDSSVRRFITTTQRCTESVGSESWGRLLYVYMYLHFHCVSMLHLDVYLVKHQLCDTTRAVRLPIKTNMQCGAWITHRLNVACWTHAEHVSHYPADISVMFDNICSRNKSEKCGDCGALVNCFGVRVEVGQYMSGDSEE